MRVVRKIYCRVNERLVLGHCSTLFPQRQRIKIKTQKIKSKKEEKRQRKKDRIDI